MEAYFEKIASDSFRDELEKIAAKYSTVIAKKIAKKLNTSVKAAKQTSVYKEALAPVRKKYKSMMYTTEGTRPAQYMHAETNLQKALERSVDRSVSKKLGLERMPSYNIAGQIPAETIDATIIAKAKQRLVR